MTNRGQNSNVHSTDGHGTSGDFTPSVRRRVKFLANFTCCWCRKAHPTPIEVHHIIPKSHGGPTTEDNAAPLCPTCHKLYGNNPDLRNQIREQRDHLYLINCSDRELLVDGVFQVVRGFTGLIERWYRPDDPLKNTIDMLIHLDGKRRVGSVALAIRNWPEGVPSTEVDGLLNYLYDAIDKPMSALDHAIVIVRRRVEMLDVDSGQLVELRSAKARRRVYVHRSTRSARRIQIVDLSFLFQHLEALQEGRASPLY